MRRRMLGCLGVVAMLVAAGVALIAYLQALGQQSRRSYCSNQLKALWLDLREYETQYNGAWPNNIHGKNGDALLSWRVLAAQFIWYNRDLRELVDFSQPWNNAKNMAVWHDLGDRDFQCPGVTSARPGITHYLAVVGPGTLWSSGKMPSSEQTKRQILLIEWPTSDIHWSEPRDVSPEEILDWLRSKPPPSSTPHRGCLLYVDGAGQVGELRTDADPETVRSLLTGT